MKDIQEQSSPIRLFITIPSNRDWKPQFALSLINLVLYVQSQGINGKPTIINLHALMQASLIPKARQMGMDAAIADKADLVLMLDDDMTFPANIVDLLYAHGKEFVAAPYVMKANWQPTTKGLDGKPLYGVSGLHECDQVGLGVSLVRMDAIAKLTRPFFSVEYLPDSNEFMGEDVTFCRRLQERGVKLYADFDAKVGHVGDFVYMELPSREGTEL